MSLIDIATLSEREKETLQLASKGLIDKEIAARLGVGFTTIRTYWKRIRIKMGTTNRSASVATFLRSSRKQKVPIEDCVMAVIEAGAAALVIGLEEEILYASDRAHDFLGYDHGDLIGQDLSAIIPGRFRKFFRYVTELQDGEDDCIGRCRNMAVVAKRENGETFRAQATFGSCKQDSGRLVVLYLVDYDAELSLRRRSSEFGELGMPAMEASVGVA